MATGALNAQGIWLYGADDPASPTPDLLNMLGQSISNVLANIGATWKNYVPVWTNLTVGNGTQVARYAQVGYTTFVDLSLTLGSTTTITGSVSVSLPVTAARPIRSGSGFYRPAAGDLWPIFGYSIGGTSTLALQYSASTAANALRPVNATGPAAYATGGIMQLAMVYQSNAPAAP